MAARFEGVVVNGDYLADRISSQARFSSSCSGISLGTKHGLILTTGAVLSPHDYQKRGLINTITTRIGRLIGFADKDQQLQKITPNIHAAFNVLIERKNDDETREFHKYKAKLVAGCFSKPLEAQLRRMMSDNWWRPMDLMTSRNFDQLLKLRMAFVVLQIQDDKYPVVEEIRVGDGQISRVVYEVLVECWGYAKGVAQGERILCESSLFGDLSPAVFMNSISQGIVVNRQGALMLADARCAPGSEGGVVFVRQNNQRLWVGMVMASLSWKQRDLLGLSLICSAESIVSDFVSQLKYPMLPAIPTGQSHKTVLTDSLRSIVLVKNGPAWGSGIVIDKSQRIILTCSHVVRNSQSVIVEVHYPEIRRFEAEILYATPENETPDMAVLKIASEVNLSHQIPTYNDQKLVIGDDVLAAGFAIFPPSSHMGVTLTSGVISKIIKINKNPVMMLTSCSVFGGASGGLIMSAASGNPLGLIVCNAKDSKKNITYPCINLAVPFASFYSVIRQFLNTGDKSILKEIKSDNRDATTLWKLGKLPGPATVHAVLINVLSFEIGY